MNWKPAVAWVALGLGLAIGAAIQSVQAGQLSGSKSPYLLSHAGSAIDWHPWDDTVLARARRENKLIFLSIGYASCHWCHVMARRTFSDPRVIRALNANYVSILVDREERPELDAYFMKIMSAMIGSSGSPANFFLTPDLVPVFAAGYLGVEPEFGDPGFLDIAKSIARKRAADPEDFGRDVAITRSQLQEMWRISPARGAAGGADPRDGAAREWMARIDRKYGGFGDGSKFPLPNVLSFLIERAVRSGDGDVLAHVYRTLDHMAAGGIRDQLGGAFHRYSVDRFWQAPHFEIMLGQNAALAKLYLSAHQASGKPRYAAVARAVLDDLLARFRLPGGGFAASLDAESESADGHYYTWTADEVRAVLGPDDGRLFLGAYLDAAHGLVRGRAILRLSGNPGDFAATRQRLSHSRMRLLEARRKRRPPGRDDKVLTSWNALAVSAFAKAAQILDDKRYLTVAQEEIRHLLSPLSKGLGLVHNRWRGIASGPVFLDDYAFAIQALLDLYEADFRIGRLDQARRLMKILIKKFQAQPGELFRMTPVDEPSPIPSQIILDESGLPSGNAAALTALHRLALYGGDAALDSQMRAIAASLGGYLGDAPGAATGLLGALEFQPGDAHEIVIVAGPVSAGHAGAGPLLREIHARALPGTVLAVISPDAPELNLRWPLLSARPMMDGRPTAYVCRKRLCKLPVNSPQGLATQLERLFIKMTRKPD